MLIFLFLTISSISFSFSRLTGLIGELPILFLFLLFKYFFILILYPTGISLHLSTSSAVIPWNYDIYLMPFSLNLPRRVSIFNSVSNVISCPLSFLEFDKLFLLYLRPSNSFILTLCGKFIIFGLSLFSFLFFDLMFQIIQFLPLYYNFFTNFYD